MEPSSSVDPGSARSTGSSSQAPRPPGPPGPPGPPDGAPAPAAGRRPRPPRRSALCLPAWLRRALIALLGALLAFASYVAANQAPHPDMFRPVGVWDFGNPAWWAYPLERNAFKRQVVRGNLNAVFALPGTRRLWAVGDSGLILHSNDDGETWVQQRPAVAPSPAAGDGLARRVSGWSWLPEAVAAVATAPLAGSAPAKSLPVANVAQQSKTAAVTKGSVAQPGATAAQVAARAASAPQQLRTPETPGIASLRAVHFVDGLRGWAVGSRGTILATRDGGSTWAAQPSGTWALLWSVQFAADGLHGWAVGREGTILATRDGGSTWAAQTSGTTASLKSIQFAADGLRGCAVGEGGTILATRDGGSTWAAQTSGTRALLLSVQFTADGLRGWAVGDDGTVLATRDGGSIWAAQPSGTRADIKSVHFTADGLRGWAVGKDGTILATRDGGTTWADAAPYRRYWAPWYFAVLPTLTLALFFVLGFVEPVRRGEARQAEAEAEAATEGAGTFLRSDQPVADKALDRLGVRPVVEALSSFIRNRGTEPRVTIAVTGEWGNGKSSVMRMLQTELDQAGFRTAWFNAWHHQQEGRPLSALFNTVRQQAVPQWWQQPLAAWRVRSRLIWGRGAFYKLVAVAMALGIALALGDMFADGWRSALDNAQHVFRHHVLQQRETAITGASLAKLDPFAHTASSPAAAASGAAATTATAADPCDAKTWPAGRKAEPVRPEVYCYLKRNLQWEEGGDASHCGVLREPPAAPGRECVFASADDLIATVEARDPAAARKLWPSERKAIRAAAETLPPPALFPWLESALVGGLAAFLALLFTKGITVYGLQLTAPLRALLAASGGKTGEDGKESAGTVERYRAEFGLLCNALDGRLVIFIDDLDRCTPETVNGMLELTNYLVDVGKCFVVIGAAMDRVMRCVRSRVASDDQAAYATAYLRKLVHIELPVPQNRPLLERLAAAEPTTTPTHDARSGFGRAARQWGLGIAAVALLSLVFWGGRALHEGGKGTALRVGEVAPVPSPAPAASAAASAMDPARPGSVALERPRDTADVGLVATQPATAPLDWLAGAALLILVAWLVRWARRNREKVQVALGGALREEDSDRFMQALDIWNPAVVSHDPTPRHVKRFYNRARLFAAYERQDDQADPTSDECLVALAAMHHLEPASLGVLADALAEARRKGVSVEEAVENWVQAGELEAGFRQETPSADAHPDESGLRRGAQFSAWRKHLATFHSAPTESQVRRFESRVKGIAVR